MNTIKIYKQIIFAGCIILMFGSCKKYLNINQNPNAALQPPIDGLLANVTNSSAINVWRIADWTSYYTQYLASPSAGSTIDTYDDVNASSAWNDCYNVLTDLYDMRKFAAEKSLNAYIGVADILTAQQLNMITNVWGDVPYSSAFLGVDNINPKFDDQKSLYDTCLHLLDLGIAELQQPDADGELSSSQ